MTLFLFLTVVQALIAAALVGVILMQKSEGGGLGVGGSPTGMLSARGAADFLTRSTRILAVLFVIMSIVLAGLAVNVSEGQAVETTLDRDVAPAGGQADPLGGGALGGPPTQGSSAPANAPGPVPPQSVPADPLTGPQPSGQ